MTFIIIKKLSIKYIGGQVKKFMRNLAIIITKLNGGGAERVASNLSIELSEFFNVKVIVFDGSNQTYPHGGELFDLRIPAHSNNFVRFINVWKRFWKVRKIKKQENVFCSISLLDGPNLVNLLSRRGDKVIVSVRNLLSKESNSILRRLIIKFVGNYSDKLVTLSKQVQNDLVKNFNVKRKQIITIYNSCDRERLLELANNKLESTVELDQNFHYVVTAGRLTEQKGQWHLIRAFTKVIEKVPNTKLLILGEGELRNKLESISIDLGLNNNVIFAGYINNPHNIIKKCDVFAFSSLYEGLGNVLLEGLALGKAIVSSDCDAGPREILAPNSSLDKKTDEIEFGEFGILVPTGDRFHLNSYEKITDEEQFLADAISMILVNEKIRLFYEKKSVIRSEDFAPQKIVRQWCELINSIE